MKIKASIHRLFNNELSSSLCGYASITLDDMIAIHGIKIMINRHGGTWVALPQGKSKNGYYDMVHPLTKELRTQINDAVLSEYKRVLAEEKERFEADGKALPAQIVIAENTIPRHAPEETLFDYFSEG